MTDQSRRDWAAIRAAYERGDTTVAELATKFAVSRSQIYRRARTEAWLVPETRATLRPISRYSKPVRNAGELAARLRAAVERQLQRLETSMERDDRDLSAADHEREARALSGLIRNLEKLEALDASQVANATRKCGPKGDAHVIDDQNAFRHSITERIHRLRERLGTDSGSPEG
ncbi:MAG: hypothetical protein AAF732_09155 [Pseudomonadota bacterium]